MASIYSNSSFSYSRRHTQEVHLILMCERNQVCPEISDRQIGEVEGYLPNLFDKKYEIKVGKIVVGRSYMTPDIMLDADKLFRKRNSIPKHVMLGFISLDSRRFKGWAGLFEGANTFFASTKGGKTEKTIAHEIAHLEGLKHTCEIPIPDYTDLRPYLEELGKCNNTTTDLMHPETCPDVEVLADCTYDLTHVFTQEDYDEYNQYMHQTK